MNYLRLPGLDDIGQVLPRVDVTIRRPGSSAPELFFVNSNTRDQMWIEGYSPIDGHFACPIEYYRACKPVAPTDSQAVALARQWGSIGPDKSDVRIVKRLTFKGAAA